MLLCLPILKISIASGLSEKPALRILRVGNNKVDDSSNNSELNPKSQDRKQTNQSVNK